jgi:hypothetical protein
LIVASHVEDRGSHQLNQGIYPKAQH